MLHYFDLVFVDYLTIMTNGSVVCGADVAIAQYQLIVNKRSWAEFKRKLKRVTKKTLGYSFAKRISMLKFIYRE